MSLIGLEMDGVTTKTTIKAAILMEVIVVVVLLIQIIAQNVYALKEGEMVELQHLLKLQLAEAAIRDG